MRPMLHPPRRFAQSGFTLVEMAIVLVIVGLLLGGVLKGQELIENARVKDAANMLKGVATAYYSYLDRYGHMPGDDNTVHSRGGLWLVTRPGNGNGMINIGRSQTFLVTPAPPDNEQLSFWQHLRAAGFIKGNVEATGPDVLPRNAWGGLVGVTFDATHNMPTAGLRVCMQNVPGKAAMALDRQMDDGIPKFGVLRANVGYNSNPLTGANEEYLEAHYYTMCMDI